MGSMLHHVWARIMSLTCSWTTLRLVVGSMVLAGHASIADQAKTLGPFAGSSMVPVQM